MKKILALGVCALLVSCTKKIHVPDVVMEVDGLNMTCLYEGEPYDGDVWSSSEHCCATFVAGELEEATIYHDNGQVAYKLNKEKEMFYYDEKGNPISKEEYNQNYRSKYKPESNEFEEACRHAGGDE